MLQVENNRKNPVNLLYFDYIEFSRLKIWGGGYDDITFILWICEYYVNDGICTFQDETIEEEEERKRVFHKIIILL